MDKVSGSLVYLPLSRSMGHFKMQRVNDLRTTPNLVSTLLFVYLPSPHLSVPLTSILDVLSPNVLLLIDLLPPPHSPPHFPRHYCFSSFSLFFELSIHTLTLG